MFIINISHIISSINFPLRYFKSVLHIYITNDIDRTPSYESIDTIE